jgi:hypothetical protein
MSAFKSLLFVALLLVSFGFGLTGCKSSEPAADAAPAAECSCDQGKAGEATWCEACDKGFVDSEAVKCKGCYDKKTGAAETCEGCDAKAADKG